MPHAIKERHLDEICAGCKQPHGNNVQSVHIHHRLYEKIVCDKCEYVMMIRKYEQPFSERFEFM